MAMPMPAAEARVAAAVQLLFNGQGEALDSFEAAEQANQLARRLEAILDGSRTADIRKQGMQRLVPEIASLPKDRLQLFAAQIEGHLSRNYEHELYLALPSTSGQTQSSKRPRFDRAETILAKVTPIYAQYEGLLDVLPQSSRESLASINQQALLAYSLDFDYAVYRDLAQLRLDSVARDALSVLGLEREWRASVYRAALRIVDEKVMGVQGTEGVASNTFGDHALDFEEEALPSLQQWLQYAVFDIVDAWKVNGRQRIAQQTTFHLFNTLGKARARQLFDIISDFPASSPALQDLMTCAESVDIKSYISKQLATALKARLLHPGASTRDIIQFYTHLIRSLRYVDPSGVILSHVIGPVRSYLRARSDTIPVIVAGLLGQAGEFTLLRDMMRDSTDPSTGLHRIGAMAAADMSMTIYDESNNLTQDQRDGIQVDIAAMDESKRMVFIPEPDDDWAPRPVDAGPDYRQSRKSDVIAIIVSIFDDEEGFINALERSCAEQIVKVRGYDSTKEYEMNENLKKRFGDASMSKCDVMLNDVKRSQRTDKRIHKMVEGGTDEVSSQQHLQATHSVDAQTRQLLDILHPLILSRQFWPLIKDDDIVLPGTRAFGAHGTSATGHAASSMMFTSTLPSGTLPANVEAQQMPLRYATALEAYQTLFPKVVHGRRLRWLPGRNVVHVHVELDDGRTLDEHVNPIQAAIIEHVGNLSSSAQQTFTTSDLASELQVPDTAIRAAMSFWVSSAVFTEILVDTYALAHRSTT
jgi:anaphase-promoting complex subunit 2